MTVSDSEESRKGMVGATGIEPMTSTVSRPRKTVLQPLNTQLGNVS